uniref:Dehydrodolichyl diphosphate synthase n=1 Tax=Dunaliella viridis TaxID=140095 RepID=A0A0D4L481_9CHLO|nr:dehydrodolichyl diphosphate synthase [Dunaliella viridis]
MPWKRLNKWARQLLARTMSIHAVPRHVAFIMDGNRRYAEKRHLQRIEGHRYGYEQLISALEWCLELGVKCVSVYAFSIDNFKRSSREVELLMHLAEQKLGIMMQEQAVLARHGVQVRVVGDLSLAPPGVQRAAATVMRATQHHTKAVLNICFSYTSSQEILQALDQTAPAHSSHAKWVARCQCSSGGSTACKLEQASMLGIDVDARGSNCAWEDGLYTQGCPPVDLLIRTSGETRLSDFMLWQCRHAHLVFTPVLWPDFGFLDLLSALVGYQRAKPTLDRSWAEAEAAWHAHQRAAQRVARAVRAKRSDSGGTPLDFGDVETQASQGQEEGCGTGGVLRNSHSQRGTWGGGLSSSPWALLQQQLDQPPLAHQQPPSADGDPPPSRLSGMQPWAHPVAPNFPVCHRGEDLPAEGRLLEHAVPAVEGSPACSACCHAGEGVAVVRAVPLGLESPCGGSIGAESPRAVMGCMESPSSPSAHSGDAFASPLRPPRWEDAQPMLRSPSSLSMHSMGLPSPLPYLHGHGGSSGSLYRSPGGKGPGSVESFCSIDLGGGEGGSQGGLLRRRRISYQDLMHALAGEH